jgi:hypothetical protein
VVQTDYTSTCPATVNAAVTAAVTAAAAAAMNLIHCIIAAAITADVAASTFVGISTVRGPFTVPTALCTTRTVTTARVHYSCSAERLPDATCLPSCIDN